MPSHAGGARVTPGSKEESCHQGCHFVGDKRVFIHSGAGERPGVCKQGFLG